MAQFVDVVAGKRLQVMPRGSGRLVTYDTVVRRVDEHEMRIDWPRTHGESLPAAPGDELMLVLQQHSRAYAFDCRVLRVIDAPSEALVVTRPQEVHSRERREHYRLMTSIVPAICAVLDWNGQEIRHIEAKILDLGGGGLHLLVREQVPIGSNLRLVFGLGDGEVDVDASIVALAVADPEVRGSSYRVNAKFIDLTRFMQERIVRYVYREQIAVMQRKAV